MQPNNEQHTLPVESPQAVEKYLREFDEIVEAIHAATDEEMPPIEPIRLREVEL